MKKITDSAVCHANVNNHSVLAKKTNKHDVHEDTDSLSDDGVPTDSEDDDTGVVRKTSHHSHKVNLPPFTGKETWKVWFTRFDEVSKRKGWSSEERLDELLPKLQGEAGNFVFDQLNSRTRNNYKLLCQELKNRFRCVENPKTFGAMFAARKQKSNETIESYAADLKKLYDKAHARRDPQTREEDLLRRFLDGLADGKTSEHVEFVKNPQTIDEAVDEVINFTEVRKNHQRSTRQVQVLNNYSSDSESEKTVVVKRAPGRPPRNTANNQGDNRDNPQKTQSENIGLNSNNAVDELKVYFDKNISDKFVALEKKIIEVQNSKKPAGNQQSNRKPPGRTYQYDGPPPGRAYQYEGPPPGRAYQYEGPPPGRPYQYDEPPNRGHGPYCWTCKQRGHIQRDCQMTLTQMKMTTFPQGQGPQWGVANPTETSKQQQGGSGNQMNQSGNRQGPAQ